MSGVQFNTQDAAIPAYDAEVDFGHKQRAWQQQQDVDTAIRGGVGDMLAQQPTAIIGPQALQSSGGAPVAQPTANPPAPDPSVVTPQLRGIAPALTGAQPGGSSSPLATIGPTAVKTTSLQQRPQQPGNDQYSFSSSVQGVEDPSGYAINHQGYAGGYQLGTAALASAGAYAPAPGEDLTTNQWKGRITLPGRDPMTVDQFVADQGAQNQAFNMHVANLDREIAARGLDQYVGQTIRGMPVTHDAIRAMMQVGGPEGAQRYLQTGGGYNPTDANGTSIGAYAQKVAGGPAAAQPASYQPSDVSGQQAAYAPPTLGSNRYNPVLARLAATPGGGAAALQLIGQQSQLDRYQLERQQQYQHLALTAFARGDNDVGGYYAQLGGLQIPPQVLANTGQRQALATSALMARRLFPDDPVAATRFTQTYVATHDIDQAFAASGDPKAKSVPMKPTWADDGQGNAVGWLVDPTGKQPAQPLLGPDNQQLRRPVAPQRQGAPKVIWNDQNQGMIVGNDGTARPITDASGQPVLRTAQSPHLQQVWTDTGDGKRTLMTFNPTTGEVSVPDSNGQPVIGAPGVSQSGKVADRVVRKQMLVAAGFDEPTANAIAAGATPSPNSMVGAYTRIQQMVQNDFTTPDEEKPAKVANTMNQMFGPNWLQTVQGRLPAGGPAPAAAAAPPPAPAAAPPPATIGPTARPPAATAPAPATPPPAAPPAAAPTPAAAPAPAPAQAAARPPATGRTAQDPVPVGSPAEAMRLPPGTYFIGTDGRVRQRPAAQAFVPSAPTN